MDGRRREAPGNPLAATARALGVLAGALVLNALLFALMQRLAERDATLTPMDEDSPAVAFIRLVRPPEPPPPAREAPRPEMPEPAPQAAVAPAVPDTAPPPPVPMRRPTPRMDAPALRLPLALGKGPFLGPYAAVPKPAPPARVTPLVPLVRIEPMYPRAAKRAGIEGWVEVEFTVTEKGTTTDVAVVRADPPGVFDRTVRRAVRRWRFQPPREGGRSQERRVRQTIRFTLDR